MRALRQLFASWHDTLKAIAGDKGVLLIMGLAPLIYGFFYPWPYAQQSVTRVPVAVVDYDHSSLSRQITRFAQASPRIEVRLLTGDEGEAQQALWRGDIEGYAILPRELKRDVLRGAAAVVNIQANGSYALLNKAVLAGFAEAVGTVSAGVEVKKLRAGGQSALEAGASRSPINTQLVALFNPTEGYGSYVVPAVALLIIQQTLLMGVGMLVGLWAETGRQRAGVATWLGAWAAEGRALQTDRSGLFFTAFLSNIQILDCKIGKNYPGWGRFSLCAPSAAQAPGAITASGWIRAISPSSQCAHAAASCCDGVLCIRRLPRGSYLKCLTALVMKRLRRCQPISVSARSNS